MEYFKCKWVHNLQDEPILLFSELDEDRYETRKIEIFRNNKIGYADVAEHSKNTDLGVLPVPPLEEINKSEEFEAVHISKEEFEQIWFNRKDPSKLFFNINESFEE